MPLSPKHVLASFECSFLSSLNAGPCLRRDKLRQGSYEGYNVLKVNLQDSVLTLTLNRPEVHNALNSELVSLLLGALKKYQDDRKVRVVVLRGEGKTFCSGGDIGWLKSLGEEAKKSDKGKRKNLDEAKHLAELFYSLNHYSKPVVGCVKGSVMGGGFGLTSVCDYVLAHEKTLFSLSELRIGVVPSVILPFILAKIGESQTRALTITGEKIACEKALNLNLVHEIYQDEDDLEKRLNHIVGKILKSAPQALSRGKKLIEEIKHQKVLDIFDHVSETLATVRAGAEAQEGLAAFLEKRDPDWLK